MEAILAAVDIGTVAVALGAVLVAGVGIRLLFVAYKFVKKAMGIA